MGPVSWIVVALFAAAVAWTVVRPRWAVLLVLLMFPVEQLLQATVPPLAARPSLLQFIVFGAACLGVGSRVMLRGGEALRGLLNPVSALTFVLYALVLVGVAYSPAPVAARLAVTEGLPYWVLMLVLLPMLIDDLDDFYRLCMPLIVVGVVAAVAVQLHPASSYYAGRLHISLPGPGGIGLERKNPLVLGDLGAMAAISAGLFVPASKSWTTILLRGAAVFFGLSLAFATARGQALGGLLVLCSLFFLARGGTGRGVFAVAGVAAVVVLGGMFYWLIFNDNQAGGRFSTEAFAEGGLTRVQYGEALLSAMANNPIAWAIGLGTHATAQLLGDPGSTSAYPHNLIVQVVGEHGMLGFTILVLICLSLAALVWSVWPLVNRDRVKRSAFTVLLGICAYAFLISMKQGSFVIQPMPFAVFLVFGRILYCERQRAYAAIAEEDEYAEVPEQELARLGPA